MKALQKFFIAILLLFSAFTSFAQLGNFTLSVTATNETCTGNGTLTLSTSGTAQGATVLYSVYLLPNTSTALIVTPGPVVTGLAAGNYRIVALQSLGSESNSQSTDVIITDVRTTLAYYVTSTPETCADGMITVNVTAGQASTYEIISGPVIVPPQASNIFTGLVAGIYNIRVNDLCGDAIVQTYTILPSSYIIVADLIINCELVACDKASAQLVIQASPNMHLNYPLTINLTIFPPSGAPIVTNHVISSGDPQAYVETFSFPYFQGGYSYNLSVTDLCGHIFSNNGNQILGGLTIGVGGTSDPAPSQISTSVCGFLPPYTLDFTSFPPGFNPADFNSEYPGPYTAGGVDFTSNPDHQLPPGDYTVEVTDACGNVSSGNATIDGCFEDLILLAQCDGTVIVQIPFLGVHVVSTIIIASSVDLGQPLPYDVSFNITDGVFAMALPYGTYTLTGINVCNEPYTFTIHLEPPQLEADASDFIGCQPRGAISGTLTGGGQIQTVIITSAPAAFTGPIPFDASSFLVTPSTFEMSQLPAGTYAFTITDICGVQYSAEVTVHQSPDLIPPTATFLAGCEAGFGSLELRIGNGKLVQVIITSAPASFSFPLPYNASFNITPSGIFYMNSLPEGDYIFHTVDLCGVEADTPFTIPGYHIVLNNISVQGNCGSFNLMLQFNPGLFSSTQLFWLQRKNPVTGVWEHPLTGAPYTEGALPSLITAYQLYNFSTNYNIAALGDFRVLRANAVFANGMEAYIYCVQTIKEFSFTGLLKIYAAYTSPCPNGSSEVFIVAGDASPLTYRITEKDGHPFIVNNGNSNIFSGLASGVYNFQVEDTCGNIVNRVFDIQSLPEPGITPSGLCDGLDGQLEVPAVSYLSYQWWNGNSPSTIISTSNTLLFSPFSNATSPGTYFVRIFSSNGLSCIDKIISIVVPGSSIPRAGNDAAISVCGSTSAVDLFTILGGTFDSSGTWEEITSSGMLNANIWLPVGISYGEYRFRYQVNGFCGDFDESFVTITFTAPVAAPVITMDQQFCSGGSIQFNAADVPGANYQWTGPQNFSSAVRNPVIENSSEMNIGIYSVTVSLNGCEASSQVSLDINQSPEFSLEKNCNGGALELSIIPDNSFNPDTAIYSWTGPANFTSSAETIIITGLPGGQYSATVTSPDGCATTKSLAVANTSCGLPSGISPNGDGSNEFFDLSGYDVLKLEIFSRYGRLVYEKDNYVNQWHGQDFKDRILPDATYYYYVRFNTGEEKTGWVYVTY